MGVAPSAAAAAFSGAAFLPAPDAFFAAAAGVAVFLLAVLAAGPAVAFLAGFPSDFFAAGWSFFAVAPFDDAVTFLVVDARFVVVAADTAFRPRLAGVAAEPSASTMTVTPSCSSRPCTFGAAHSGGTGRTVSDTNNLSLPAGRAAPSAGGSRGWCGSDAAVATQHCDTASPRAAEPEVRDVRS